MHGRGDEMKIGVPMEPEGETRVAIVPGSMKKLQKQVSKLLSKKAQVLLLITPILNTLKQALALVTERMSCRAKS